MNDLHLQLLASDGWPEYLETDLMPWVLGTADLGDDVLEIGPGPGLTTDVLRRRVANLMALELDSTLAAALRQRMGDADVRLIQGDATKSGLPSATFSSVTCFTMLHHSTVRPSAPAIAAGWSLHWLSRPPASTA